MTVSSRTPEGEPQRCPICLREAAIEPSEPTGDSCCPTCGHLLWRVRDRLSRGLGVSPDQILLTSTLAEIGGDSLDLVELVMELEEELDVEIPDDAAARMKHVADVLRYVLGARGGGGSG